MLFWMRDVGYNMLLVVTWTFAVLDEVQNYADDSILFCCIMACRVMQSFCYDDATILA